MSGPDGRTFLTTLREVDEELPVPVPDRVRILQELEHDLEGLRDHFLAEGLAADEARRRAVAALVPDAESLSALGRVHRPLYEQVTRHLPGSRLRLLERSILAAATVSVLIIEALALLRADMLTDPSPFLWPVLGLGAVMFAFIGGVAFRLWIKRDVGTSGGAGGILVLAGVIPGVGIAGTLLDSYRLAARLERSPELAGSLALEWLIQDAGLLSISLGLAMAGGLAWFVITQWLAHIRSVHRRTLGVSDSVPLPRESK